MIVAAENVASATPTAALERSRGGAAGAPRAVCPQAFCEAPPPSTQPPTNAASGVVMMGGRPACVLL